MPANLTQHAAARLQQHSIPHHAVELLIEFGSTTRCRGASSFFDRAARCRIGRALDTAELRRVERFLNAYAVVSDSGELVTVAWRTRRLRRH